MDPSSRSCFPALRIFQQGSQAVIQPAFDGNAADGIETLHLDLATGKPTVSISKEALRGDSVIDSLGLLGVCKLHKGVALLAITKARKVAELGPPGAPAAVYELAGAAVLTEPGAEGASRENRQLIALLKDAVDPAGPGRGIYFSHFTDLTLSAQRAAERDADPATATAPLASVARAERRFWYNHALARPLLDAGAHRFTPPAILGFVRQLPGLSFATPGHSGAGASATLTLIARRGVDRAGTRQWRRGLDSEGNVANFAETEELLTTPAGDVASFVEIRGSIPLLWTQLPNIKYKPTTVIAAPGQSASFFDAHIAQLKSAYKHVVAINLINHKGTEGKLEVSFRNEATRYVKSAPDPALHYLAFDFHHECSKGRYHRLSLLWEKIRADFDQHGFFLRRADGTIERRQAGVMRTNCIDCLDRTNVVQGVMGRKALEAMLAALGLMPPAATAEPAHDGEGHEHQKHGHGLPEAFPAVEREFKILWADHGDALSEQYAGTGAMKSGFTRTGKRTPLGVVDDGWKAVARYYFNNFTDGVKQDAVDLFSGAYAVAPGSPLPLRPQPSALLPILVALAAIVYGAHQAGQALSGGLLPAAAAVDPPAAAAVEAAASGAGAAALRGGGGTAVVMARAVLGHVVLPLVLGVGLLGYIYTHGRHLVNKPQLCPHLAVTVQAPKTRQANVK